MVDNGKENLQPNVFQQNETESTDTNVVKPMENLFDQPPTSALSTQHPQRPLLFSEIVFNDVNGQQFGIPFTNLDTNQDPNPATATR